MALPGTTTSTPLAADISCDGREGDRSNPFGCKCSCDSDPRSTPALRAATAGVGEAVFKIRLLTLLHPSVERVDSERTDMPSLRSQMASRGDRTPCCLPRSARGAPGGKYCAAGVVAEGCIGESKMGE